VTGATTPPSTGITVRGDLSAIGGASLQAFYNDGTHGDVTAGDSVYSYAHVVSSGTGAVSVPFTVSDAQGRSSNGSIALTIGPSGEFNESVHGGGDAADLPGTAPTVDLNGSVSQIRGTLGTNDADMYKIHLCAPGSFSASTVGGTTVDTQLFVFNSNGTGVVMDDDEVGGTTLQSRLTSNFTSSLPAGDYYLAVSSRAASRPVITTSP
jgi:hypothetical protein